MGKGTALSHTAETSFISDIKKIVEEGRRASYGAISSVIIETYWHIGRRIVEQEQNGKERAEYGKYLIKTLSDELTRSYGRGWSVRNLQYFRSFYLTYSDIQIMQLRLHNLTWTHILTTLRVEDLVAARWHLQTASDEMWSVRTLDRNISTQYFERYFKKPHILDAPENKVVPEKLEILKSPVMAEFLGFLQNQQGHRPLFGSQRQRAAFRRQIHAVDAHRGGTPP